MTVLTTTSDERTLDERTLDEPTLDERLVDAATGALELFGVHLGVRLGLYEALRAAPHTATTLADAAGIAPRYAQEWLEQQAVAGVLTVEDASAPADGRRYALPDAHVGVLVDPVALDHVAPLAGMVVGIAAVLDEVERAYRTGGGVPYRRYGTHFRTGQGAVNRPAFTTALVEEWLPAVDGVVERLAAGGRVLDVACGQGWSTAAVARAFPNADVLGIDSDEASIADARAIDGHGARFEVRDAAALDTDSSDMDSSNPDGDGFDVALLLEALHDLARPVEALAAVRGALTAQGVLLVADEAVAPAFTAPGDDVERMMYGWSITHCLPAALAEPGSAGIGTAIREGTVRELARQAGFGDVEVLDVDGGFFRLYALRP